MRPLKKRLWILVIGGMFALGVWTAVSKRQSSPVRIKAYRGPLFDAMTQWQNGRRDLDVLVERVKNAGVSRLAIFTRRPEYGYRPRFFVDDEKDLRNAKKKYPEFLALGTAKYFRYEYQLTGQNIGSLERDLATGLYSFVSEVMFRHADKKKSRELTAKGERFINPSDPRVLRVLQLAEKYSKPVQIHWELYKWDEDVALFDKMFSDHPRHTFILSHMGFGHAEQIDYLMKKHPNFMATISKKRTRFELFLSEDFAEKQGSSILDDEGVVRPEWMALIVRYHDRILFATDAHLDYTWDIYEELIAESRRMIGQFPPRIREFIAYKNADRVYRLATPTPGGSE